MRSWHARHPPLHTPTLRAHALSTGPPAVAAEASLQLLCSASPCRLHPAPIQSNKPNKGMHACAPACAACKPHARLVCSRDVPHAAAHVPHAAAAAAAAAAHAPHVAAAAAHAPSAVSAAHVPSAAAAVAAHAPHAAAAARVPHGAAVHVPSAAARIPHTQAHSPPPACVSLTSRSTTFWLDMTKSLRQWGKRCRRSLRGLVDGRVAML
eukprot:361013-Chlamydomonas_euryale.AAC.2